MLGVLIAGVANEVFGFGWWEAGYPISGGGFANFLLGWGIALTATIALNLLLAWIEQPKRR